MPASRMTRNFLLPQGLREREIRETERYEIIKTMIGWASLFYYCALGEDVSLCVFGTK